MFKPLKPSVERMKLPWKLKDELEEKEERIEKLEDRIEELEDEKDSWRQRFEAEKERRSKLSREKQEAEEERNKLKEKRETSDSGEEVSEGSESRGFEDLTFDEARSVLRRIGAFESEGDELVTVYCREELEDISDLRTLKNSIPKEKYSVLEGKKSFTAFSDPILGVFMLKMNPFFSDRVSVSDSFMVEDLLDFIGKEKYWCLVSAGETEIFREENGEYEQVERIKNRVNSEHKKGGFSQGRFERKREEQIDQHVEQVQEALENYEEVFLIGEKKLCKKLEGEYLGGFDPNRKKPGQFYGFRFRTFF
ncbi:MAG: hypothetical protein ACI8Z7_000774 [Candidatus Nanohaloarchaea archaeon]|jgi:hypothetical protein